MKLLRVLQEHQYERVGESSTRTTHARIIAATNADLRVALREGRLREDLYYRLCVVPIEVPRCANGVKIFRRWHMSLLNRIAAQHGLVRRISPQAMRLLLDYSWPGNVRELANVIEYAVAVARMETILPEDLPAGDPPCCEQRRASRGCGPRHVSVLDPLAQESLHIPMRWRPKQSV